MIHELILLQRFNLGYFWLHLRNWVWLLSSSFSPSLWSFWFFLTYSFLFAFFSILLTLIVCSKAFPVSFTMKRLLSWLWVHTLSKVFNKFLIIFEAFFASIKRSPSAFGCLSTDSILAFILLWLILEVFFSGFIKSLFISHWCWIWYWLYSLLLVCP